MNINDTIKIFLELIEVKTQEGVNKLINLCIGTPEYETMVQHVVSNINLLKQYGGQQYNKPPKDNLEIIIGKEFE